MSRSSNEPVVLRPVDEVTELAGAVVAQCRAELELLMPGCTVEHVGATALSTGLTKADVDVNLRLPESDFAGAVVVLRGRYAVAQPQNWTATCASFTDDSKALPLGIQVCVLGSSDDFLVALRDLMTRDPDLRARYDEAKQGSARLGSGAYWKAKNAFLQALLPHVRPRSSP